MSNMPMLEAAIPVQELEPYVDWLGDGTIPWFPVFEELGPLSSNPRLIVELRDKSG